MCKTIPKLNSGYTFQLNLNTLILLLHGIYSIYILTGKTMTYNMYIGIKSLQQILYALWSNINTQSKMLSDLLISDYPNYALRFLSIYNFVIFIYYVRRILNIEKKFSTLVHAKHRFYF